jgi:hypothetical protein
MTKLQIAKQYQRKIAGLQKERDNLYTEALKNLKMPDTNTAFDWLYGNQTGHGAFTESLKEK